MKNIITMLIIAVLLATTANIWSEDTETASTPGQTPEQELSLLEQQTKKAKAIIKNALSFPHFILPDERDSVVLEINKVAENIAASKEYDSFLKSLQVNASMQNGKVVVSWEYEEENYSANSNGVIHSTVDQGLKTSNPNETKNGPMVITTTS